ncbi:stage II sporulation protein P [Alkalibacillus filiformis]|uniref:Stage II sporulation protein P n=1 Tax=Alkalibacillus filiformis TaxID=200990 RepID=A0ABU0DRK6_9BACI|nr:stage II sporulation protein P [Alkalibacillus filiformis]MDQ0351078.1 stage II sporulation protein P [Alkalibacillus filiformis]
MNKLNFNHNKVKQLKRNPFLMFIILFLCVWMLIPLFSKNFSEASTNILQGWVNEIDGASFSYLMTVDQPIMSGVLDQQEEPLTFSSVIIPAITDLPYQDLRMLFGHELPNFPGQDSTIVIAGSGTNYFTTSIESAPPEYIFEAEDEVEVNEERQVEDYENQSVFIYNAHNREAFLPYMDEGTSAHEAFSHTENVVDLSLNLQRMLGEYGIESHVDQTDHYQVLQQEDLAYADSYNVARRVLEQSIEENDDIEYFVDIHRDAQPHHITTTEINGQSVAKLMFIVGGNHENYDGNLRFAAELHQMLEERYPTLSRGVEVKQGPRTNGVFNQDIDDQKILLEVGGVDNNFEELNRSLEKFAEVFAEYYQNQNN